MIDLFEGSTDPSVCCVDELLARFWSVCEPEVDEVELSPPIPQISSPTVIAVAIETKVAMVLCGSKFSRAAGDNFCSFSWSSCVARSDVVSGAGV